MEKHGVIKAGITPPEKIDTELKSAEKRAQVEELDNDFRKKAAETTQRAYK